MLWCVGAFAMMPTFHTGLLVRVMATMFLTQLPANAPREVGDNGSSTSVLATNVGHLDGVPGS